MATATRCSGRDYCNPSQTGCGEKNHQVTWFYTDQARSCSCVNTCFGLSQTYAQNYCDNHAENYYGGTFQAYCWDKTVSGACCESDYICIRTGWDSNNQLNCCLGTLNDAGHCHPDWCPQNLDSCKEVLIPYCSQEQHVATNQTCVSFCSLPENKVHCDQAMRRYCSTHQSDSLCTCLNSTIPRPSCFDTQCTLTGYQTQEMVENAKACGNFCGEFINCVNVGECSISNTNFIENCNERPNPPQPDPIPSWVWAVIGIGLLAMILIFGAYLIYSRYA